MTTTSPVTLSVSSFCLREELGPIVFRFPDPAGHEQVFTLDNPKLFDLGDFPRRAREEFGVDAIETVGFQFAGLDDPEIDRFAESLRSSGVRLVNIALDTGDLLDPDDTKRAADIAELRRWIERFAAMGSSFVRVNPGSPMSPHHGGEPPAHVVAALVELGVFARERGSRLLVENHGGPSSDPVWLGALLDAVGAEHCGLLLDLGNFDALLRPAMAMFFGGEDGARVDPGTLFAGVDLESLYDGIEALAPRAELVHVKSHVVDDDGTVGAVDLERALGILARHDYGGPLTIEYEGQGGDPWAKSRRVLDVATAAFADAQAARRS
jgi:sugar phosphate isomerase/epimerase